MEVRLEVFRVQLYLLGCNRDGSALGHGVPCVGCKIQEHLPQLTRVDADFAQVRVGIEGDGDAFAHQLLQERDKFLNIVVGVDDLGGEHLPASEGEQLGRERGSATAGGLYLTNGFSSLRILIQGLESE